MNDADMMGAILADDMGLGKSLQTITLIWTLLKQNAYGQRPLVKRILLVCPCSLVQNWQNEFRKWLGDQRLKVLALTKTQDQKTFEHTAAMNPVLIMSYEMALRCERLKQMDFDMLVCDEGHRLKNAAVKINTTLTSLDIPRRVLLTGTPVQNDLQELYALVDFVNPGHLGQLKTFKRVYETAIAQGRDGDADEDQVELGKDRVQELQAMISLCVLRRTADVNSQYLPSKTDFVLFCRPSPLQIAVYRQVLMGVVYSSMSAQHFAVIDALRKVCNHPALILKRINGDSTECVTLNRNVEDAFPEDYGCDGMKVDDSGKLTVLCELLAAIHGMSQKVVIASNFTQTLDLIEQLCVSANYKCLRLDGSTPQAKRDEYIQRFNSKNGSASVFLLSTKAGGVGVNLIGASRLILYDCDWNPANDQ
uniref:DNA repair and recombination protein RAD54-like n=1 Tax=Plectus sambesii TaxID=2011161 RepID=A0A914XF18_9BILA